MTPTNKNENAESHNLTEEDIKWIHEQRQQTDHEKWLRGQLGVIWPWVVAIITALVAGVSWIKDHVKW